MIKNVNVCNIELDFQLTTKWDVNLGACSIFPFSTQLNITVEVASPKAFLAVQEYFPASEVVAFSTSKITIPNEWTVFNLEPKIIRTVQLERL